MADFDPETLALLWAGWLKACAEARDNPQDAGAIYDAVLESGGEIIARQAN